MELGYDGTVKTFSRGGSDVTGSIVAKAVHADMYENWTDVSGFLIADPRVVKNPKAIDVITYRELRELILHGSILYFMKMQFSRYVKKVFRSISVIRT